ncbi:MAG TPA: hypothetical protein VF274_06390 [Alphaproteobacteria bacterium]
MLIELTADECYINPADVVCVARKGDDDDGRIETVVVEMRNGESLTFEVTPQTAAAVLKKIVEKINDALRTARMPVPMNTNAHAHSDPRWTHHDPLGGRPANLSNHHI